MITKSPELKLVELLANSSDVANSSLSLTAIGLFYKVLSLEAKKNQAEHNIETMCLIYFQQGLVSSLQELHDAIDELVSAGLIELSDDRGMHVNSII